MLDDPENHDDGMEAGSFLPDFSQALVPTSQSVIDEMNHGVYGGPDPLFGHFEPMLDTDPFGLSASMHFRTPFGYEQNVHQ
jgi:hypothetical protein